MLAHRETLSREKKNKSGVVVVIEMKTHHIICDVSHYRCCQRSFSPSIHPFHHLSTHYSEPTDLHHKTSLQLSRQLRVIMVMFHFSVLWKSGIIKVTYFMLDEILALSHFGFCLYEITKQTPVGNNLFLILLLYIIYPRLQKQSDIQNTV